VAPVTASASWQDFALPDAPALVAPPLSLLDIATELINLEGLTAQASEANEKAQSAQTRASDIAARLEAAPHDERLMAQLADAEKAQFEAEQWASDTFKKVADLERWTKGFTWEPELPLSATETWAPDTRVNEANLSPGATNLKHVGDNTIPFAWYNPFVVIARDARSTFGWNDVTGINARIVRALRALRAHEPWRCENEFWTGALVPTNYHLTCSPGSVMTSPDRTLSGTWPNPTAAEGTTLGVPVGLGQALAALDDTIGNASAGLGMIHATPFLVQRWSSIYTFIADRLNTRTLTVNGNAIVPGYGYPGTGPDQTARTVTDAAFTNGSPNVSSATAAFTDFDIGSVVTGTNAPAGAYIIAVTSSSVAVMNVNATATNSAQTVTIGGGVGDLSGQRYQWAYATEMQYYCKGDARTYPWDINQASPSSVQQNAIDIRAERSWAIVSNMLLRAAVLVDTATP
jgi:hypothetical protein